jgi:hypothetical protein
VHYCSPWRLYDLSVDPGESRNVYGNAHIATLLLENQRIAGVTGAPRANAFGGDSSNSTPAVHVASTALCINALASPDVTIPPCLSM